ncbi:MAG: carbamoyl-phosphate synthase large subunit [Chloroflexota bacterium]|nr:carbamoyl-phosphate synthase large subunit [Chloroflexota bacterium]
MSNKPSKVLVIGSGPIVIGQAAEFDYAGTQACKALREEGVTSVLVNSNPATIMTDEEIADIVYIEPLTVDSLSRIIERERPDGLLPTLGGQTALNLAVELADQGILDKYDVRLLGTPLETIRNAEDRQLFREIMIKIGEPVPESQIVTSIEQGQEFMEKVGLPLVVRPAYTLGGTGGGIAHTPEELDQYVTTGLSYSPISQVLVEKSLLGWKEVEYEVMRDSSDICITVCNMENLDPMGVHTGDSIVVAPSQTLTDKEYQMLRSASLKIIRELGIEGGCNVQLALEPNDLIAGKGENAGYAESSYYVIEVNPRVSRSSALASKATGYPIARVAAKIAVGKRLDEIANAVTQTTTAAFEPALDYCVVKIPRWPFDKFASADRSLGTQMKATGEVMAIDRSFEAALQKAVRSMEAPGDNLLWEDNRWSDNFNSYESHTLPLHANDLRIWALMAALRRDVDLDDLSIQTGIDPWFIRKLNNILLMEKRLLSESISPRLLKESKRLGFSDSQIATLADRLPEQVRELRSEWNIQPVYKMVDTCAAEFEAYTPYFYSTYEDENEAIPLEGPSTLVIGSGPTRIGQGIEFDYCSVHAAWALQEEGVSSIMINSNPETVSTDFDTSTRLYFEPLDEEGVSSVIENESKFDASTDEQRVNFAAQFGGQTAINLIGPLHRRNFKIIGTTPEVVDLAENRQTFDEFVTRIGIPRPPGAGVTSIQEGLSVADAIGYPVLVRPSYVLGGRAMEIVHDPEELIQYVTNATVEFDANNPIQVDKYLEGKEIEVDAVSDGENVLIPGVMEHIERAGVHSGDSMAIYPAVTLTSEEEKMVVDHTVELGRAFGIKGLMNIQFVIMQNEAEGGKSTPPTVYVLEVNVRSSRTIPFISKITGVPMVKIASKITLGKTLESMGYTSGLVPKKNLVAVKAPVSSMAKLSGADTYLGPEMKSTGEVMGVDTSVPRALFKALQAANLMMPVTGSVLVTVSDRDKEEAAEITQKLITGGYKVYATEGTAAALEAMNIPIEGVPTKYSEEGSNNTVDLIKDGTIQAVVNTMSGQRTPLSDGFEIRRAATESGIPCYTSLDTFRVAVDAVTDTQSRADYNIRPLSEYVAGIE